MKNILERLHSETLGFDPEALAAKYKSERDRRVREDAEAQYVRVGNETDQAKNYVLNDPYTPVVEREPIAEEREVVIIGAGWVGMQFAARFHQAGIEDVRIIDAGADFGGTWYWNRYPGAQCDVESYIYMPLLEETGYIPKLRYSYAAEIFEHAQRIARHFDLYKNALFQTWVTELRWEEGESRWIISTNRGDRIRARYVCLGTGPSTRPRLPGIPGISDFKGHSFHTSRWDYDYTGGDNAGGLHKLADKKVAIIGTGATAAQCVPALGASAKQLYVFQRTPSSVDLRNNAETPADFGEGLEPGWQRRRQDGFALAMTGEIPCPEHMKSDGWMRLALRVDEFKRLSDPQSDQELADVVQLADYKTMQDIRDRAEEAVEDKETAEKLKAYYNQFCKRPVFNDEYLPTFNRPNVELVDVSASRGIDRITQKGIVANGREYEVDCIVYASGFEITSSYERRIGIPIFGEGGKSLYDHWENGMRSMHGLLVDGFPNMFLCGGLFVFQLGANYVYGVEVQAEHVAATLAELKRRGAKVVQPSAEGEEAWVSDQLSRPRSATLQVLGGAPQSCTPGYYNQEGAETLYRDNRLETYGGGLAKYEEVLREWREHGDMKGLEISS